MFLWTLAQLFEYHYSDLLWSRVQVKATPVMDRFGHSKPYTNSLARQTVISRRQCSLDTSKTQVKIMFSSCATKTCTVVLLILIGQHCQHQTGCGHSKIMYGNWLIPNHYVNHCLCVHSLSAELTIMRHQSTNSGNLSVTWSGRVMNLDRGMTVSVWGAGGVQ